MREPIIGLPTYNPFNGEPDFVMRQSYCRAIFAAGGIPLLLPLIEEEGPLRRLYDLVDGLLLAGGGDVAAEFYGAADSGKLTLIDRPRDRVEIALTRWALAEGLPVLGICRGIQTLNVAAGGTLVQDIPSEVPEALKHRAGPPKYAGDYIAHTVTVASGSLLADVLAVVAGPEGLSTGVNSRHHQAVRDVAPGFVVTARADDGVIEGIEAEPGSHPFALGVQWHPENMVPQHPPMVRLFSRFVAACQG